MVIEWWLSLSVLERLLAYVAIPATLLLIVQTILTCLGLFGADETDTDSLDMGESGLDGIDTDGLNLGDSDTGSVDLDSLDIGADVDGPDLDAHLVDSTEHFGGLHLLTFRGIVAFLAVGGWTGLALSRWGCSSVWSLVGAVCAGGLAMLLLAWVLYLFVRLQSNGNRDYRNAVGKTANVYLAIPPEGDGYGKVTILLQGTMIECDAVQEGNSVIPTGAVVKVVGVHQDEKLVVKGLEK